MTRQCLFTDEPIELGIPPIDDEIEDEDAPFYLGDMLFYYLVDLSGGLPNWMVRFINVIDRGFGLLVIYCIFTTIFMFVINLFPRWFAFIILLAYALLNLAFHCGVVYIGFFLVNIGILISRRKIPNLHESATMSSKSNTIKIADITPWLLIWFLVVYLFFMQWYQLSWIFAAELLFIVILTMAVSRMIATGENSSTTIYF